MTTVAELVEAARDPAGSLEKRHAAFTRLVEQSQHIVFGLALTSLRDLDDARDVAQDAFAIAWHRLPQLRDPAAFPAWLKSIVARECSRHRRRRTFVAESILAPPSVDADTRRVDYESVVAAALDQLAEGERDVIVLFYFLGHSLPEIARMLRLKPGTVGKRLHSARLRIRKALPRTVRNDFMQLVPSQNFVTRVQRGLLDEYVGEFRFERRPDHVIRIIRDGESLIADAGEQRHVLVVGAKHSLVARHYDGEGRFGRNRHGEVTHFVYYEFGRRIGVARKVSTSTTTV
jgi:RNA polymerase sigma-70 factor, ECF subfamily